MNKILNVINLILFISVAFCIMAIFYEGLTLKWYSFVPVLMIMSDGFFIIATIMNLVVKRKVKLLLQLNIFSAIIILIAFITKFMGIEHPKWCVTIWYFYILYLYGIQVLLNIYSKIHSKN